MWNCPEAYRHSLVIQNLWDDFQSFIGWIGSTAEATLGGLKDTIAEHEPQLQAIMDLLSDVQQKFSEAFGAQVMMQAVW